MKRSAATSWFDVCLDAWSLGMEASFVAGLRRARIAMGAVPAAAETRLMVTEKMRLALELQVEGAFGGLGATPLSASSNAVERLRRLGAANRRRLSR